MTDILSVALRAASFVLMLQAAGTALFSGTFGARLASSAAGVRSIGRVSALLAILAVIGHYVLQAGRMAGDLSGVWSGALQAIVLHSAGGAEAALRRDREMLRHDRAVPRRNRAIPARDCPARGGSLRRQASSALR